ncbi:hypothetical protein WR25_04281 [Diploscapter pachys]|uniref:RNA methyltransferase n=1 Tax=Diploscapter pachys TaxID=2018661 RepID=A0A2A2KVH9_9BILA|nr:hypothetical protein WR25_04281 [Diploscapter pachys]
MDVSMNVASSEVQSSRAESRKRPAHHDSLIEKDNSNANGNGEVNGELSSNGGPARKFNTPKRKKFDNNQSNHTEHRKQNQNQQQEQKEGARLEEDKEKKPLTNKDKKEQFNQRYCYGNFDKYYGTRLVKGEKDPRLEVLQKDWFYRKSILDIGIDIDSHLVGVARKNIRHYCDANTEFAGNFPASFSSHFGPVSTTSLSFSTKFPDNVWFRKENYVLENETLLDMVEPEFEVIMALSITKWIHLNFGDDGMRLFFKRAFKQLLPGGRFVLEAQHFGTYKKRARMTETTKKNYFSIEFKPDDFEMYLLEEIGFERVEHLGVPQAKSKGFERCIDVYVKPADKPMWKVKENGKSTASSSSACSAKNGSEDAKKESEASTA